MRPQVEGPARHNRHPWAAATYPYSYRHDKILVSENEETNRESGNEEPQSFRRAGMFPLAADGRIGIAVTLFPAPVR